MQTIIDNLLGLMVQTGIQHIILIAATLIFAALLAERFYLRNIMHLELPKKKEQEEGEESLPYDLITIKEVNPPHLRIEWTEFKFISFKNAIRLVFFLFTFAITLIALKLVIFPDITIYPWAALEIIITIITLVLVVVPLFIIYFFVEVFLNTDTIIEKILMLLIPFGSALLFFAIAASGISPVVAFDLSPGRETLHLLLILGMTLIFVPLVYIANLLIGINFGAILANDWSVFRHGWDYLNFDNRTWFDRVSALAGLFIVAPAPIFAIHTILSVLTGTVSEGGLITWVLIPYFQGSQAAVTIIQLFGFWTIFDTVFLQLAVVLKFLKQTCFISIVGGTSPDAPTGVAPQAVFLTLSYVVYLLFLAVGQLITTPFLRDPVTGASVFGPMTENIVLSTLADISPLLLLVSNVVFLAHVFFLDWNIYPTESGIIFIADSEFSGLDTFPVIKYIRRANRQIEKTIKLREAGDAPLSLRAYIWGLIDLGIGVAVFVISLIVFADEFTKLAGVIVGFVVGILSTFLMPKR
ncbi:MAG: hypothetical protein ACFFBD_00960 [Candidatus Hodarchaeota archaeon]